MGAFPVIDFYPRPPRGGRRVGGAGRQPTKDISIHALREEGDYSLPTAKERPYQFLSTPSARRATGVNKLLGGNMSISIHALREEGDPPTPLFRLLRSLFLSTPSARRATLLSQICEDRVIISIHALREEGDRETATAKPTEADFYPRPPRGGRHEQYSLSASRRISIHALREEGDTQPLPNCSTMTNFYPRPPRGGRPA